MQTTEKQRPQWNHPDVKTLAVAEVIEDIRTWAVSRGAVPEDHNQNEFLALVTLAMIESPDAYDFARYIHQFFDWPVNGELTRIIDRAYLRLKILTPSVVRKWVLATGIRFPHKEGVSIAFRIGGVNMRGTIKAVIAGEAVAMVEVFARKPRIVRVMAEEVLHIVTFNAKPEPADPIPDMTA